MPGRLGGSFTASLDLAPQADGRTLARLDANAPHARIKLQSLISASESFEDTTLLLDMSGPNIAVILDAAGLEGFRPEGFEVSGTVEKEAGAYRVQNVIALVGDDRLRIDGRIGENPWVGNTDLQVEFRGSDIGASVAAFGGQAERLPKGGYSFDGGVQFRDGELRLDNVRGVIGDAREYEFELSGFIHDGVNFAGSEVDVVARGASIAALADMFKVGGLPEYSFDVSANIRRGVSNTYVRGGEFRVGGTRATFEGHVGDSPLTDDLEFLLTTQTDELHDALAAVELPTHLVPAGRIDTRLAMRREGGELGLQELRVSINGMALTASGNIGDLPELEETVVSVSIEGADLSAVLPASLAQETLAHRFSLETELRVNGGMLSLTEVSATLDQSTLLGTASISLDPLMQSGRVEATANSPDMFLFLPDLKNVAIQRVAPLTFGGAAEWSGSFWQFDEVSMEIGKGYLSIDGSIDGPPALDRTDLKVNWHASSLTNYSELLRRELPDQPLTLSGHLVGSEDSMSMEDVNIRIGSSDVQGRFRYFDRDVPYIELDLTSTLLDLGELQPEPEETEEDVAESPDPDQRLIPDQPLPLELLRVVNVDFSADVGRFKTRIIDWANLGIDASLQDGAIGVERFVATGQRGGTVNATGSLLPNSTGGADITFAAQGDGLVVGFQTGSADELDQLPSYEVDIELAGTGANPREIAASLDGFFRMVGGEGRYRAGAFSMFTQDVIAQLISALNPLQQTDPYTNVECVTILARFEDGDVTGQPLLVQKSDKLLILGNAEIDLETEKLDVGFQTIPQKGLGIALTNLVNPYIRLGGTLAAPSLELNPERVLVEGGLAVATAGISVLAKSFRDRFITNQDPCADAIEEADKVFYAE